MLFSYRNIGETVDSGLELGFNSNPRDEWSWFCNYSYQDKPEVTGIDPVTLPNGTVRDAVDSPREHRANLGVAYDKGNFFVNANMNYQDEAFWTDVLDSRFFGPTDAFTQVNLGLGFRFAGTRRHLRSTPRTSSTRTFSSTFSATSSPSRTDTRR